MHTGLVHFFWTLGYDRMLIMSTYIDLWLLRSITSARSDWCCYYEQCSPTMWTGLVLFVTLVTTIHVYLCYDHLTLTCDCFWTVCAHLVGVLWTLGTTISYYKHLHPLVSFLEQYVHSRLVFVGTLVTTMSYYKHSRSLLSVVELYLVHRVGVVWN